MSMFNGVARRWLNRLMAGVLAIGVAACGGGGGSAGEPPFGGGGGGGGGGTRTVADLSVVLNRTTVANNGTDGVTLTVTSLDASRVALGSVPVSFAIDNGGVITPAGTTTDSATGVLTATAGIGSDRTSRTIRVTVTAASVTKTVSFDVVDSVTGGRVADLAMTTNRVSIPSDGSAPMQVTITTLDANRLALGGSPVTLSVTDAGGDAFVTNAGQQTTDNLTGQMVATVQLGTVRTKRTLSLTATSGTVSRTISFDVVDPVVSVPVAADMTLALSTLNIGNAGSEVVNVTATAVDSRRNAVANIPITFEVNSNATLVVVNGLTDANGEAKARVGIGADRSNRTITVTARSDGLAPRTASFRVTGVAIQSTALPALPVASSSNNKVEYRVVDVNQNPMAEIPITVTPSLVAADPSLGPVVKSGVTDANGAYVYTYTAPAQSGLITFTANAAGKDQTQEVTVPAPSTTVDPPTGEVLAPALLLSANVVRINTGTDTSNRVEIRATFRTTAGVPVRYARVQFRLIDPASVGGVISSGTQIVYSDINGNAVSSYTPSDRPSSTNGLTIRACWGSTDAAALACTTFSDVTLTVVSDPLSVTIGTDNTIEEGPSGLTYIKRFVLLVVDAAGNPKSDVQLTPSVDLERYGKGFYTYNFGLELWEQTNFIECTAEDVNRNGTIDGTEDNATTPGGFGNGNGQLDPRKSDVSISLIGSTRTDANGTAIMRLEYPKSFGSWAYAKISVSASGVLSPPATDSRWLPIDADELPPQTPEPSFRRSPYGTTLNCRVPN